MKHLYLLRHGKSSWETPANGSPPEDRDRPLLPKGIRRTEHVARWINEHRIRFDSIHSSDARRATETANIVRKTLEIPKKRLTLDPAIYDAVDGDELLQIVTQFSDRCDAVLMVGHNPTMSELASMFFEEPLELPTAGFVGVTFETDSWRKLSQAAVIATFVLRQH